MKRRKIIIPAVIGSVIIIGIIASCIIIGKVNKWNTFMAEVEINEIDLSLIKDGIYYGYTDAGPIIVELTVSVSDSQIEEIDLLKHINGRGNAADGVINNIIRQQSLLVDTISGATLSSMVILDTVESALVQQE